MTTKDPYAAPSRLYPTATAKTEAEVEATSEVHEGRTDEEVPSGTIAEIRTWVGDDTERAASALEVEQAKDNPRVTLVEYLEGLVHGE